jgi:hypothetical protein
MTVKTAAQDRNEQVIRRLYALAEGKSKDTPAFVSQFAEGGYFYDVGAGRKYYGKDIGVTVDVYATAFPDMHSIFPTMLSSWSSRSTARIMAISFCRQALLRPPESKCIPHAATFFI